MHAAARPSISRGPAWGRATDLLRRPAGLLAGALLAEADRWPLWLPVGIALGILLLLALPGPPPAAAHAAAGLTGLAAAVLAARLRAERPLLGLALGAVAAAAAGFLATGLRLATVAAPVLPRAGVWTLEGRVIELEPRRAGVRIVLDRLEFERLPEAATPRLVRLAVRHGADELEVGARVRLKAVLQPPRGPVVPGGFDHARHAWFEGLGGLGWALGRPQRLEPPPEAAAELALARLRAALTERFTEPLPGPTGAVAAALVTGARAGLDAELWSDFQVSGLAHLLSISGLHMSLVAGTLFLAGRWLLALVPPLAARIPARKPAALVALLGAAFYLLISGASVPTQRSFLMVAAALLAILVGRDPFSIRLLAWAATLVLLLRPEVVVGASFQLSFAAVLALIAVWERLGRRAPSGHPGPLGQIGRYALGVAATTLVASLATTPLAAFHFQTVASWGVLSNLVAVPLTTFWIMPAGLLALLLVPLGLDRPAVALMGAGVELLLATARLTADLPGAGLTVPAWPTAALGLVWAGGLWLGLWRRAWRWLGLGPILLALAVVALHRPPDLVVTPWLAQIAVRTPLGARVLAFEDDDQATAALARALGGAVPDEATEDAAAADGLACDRAGCTLARGGARVVLARRLDAVLEACRAGGLVIARLGPERCPDGPAELVGPRALARSGGLALWLDAGGPGRRRAVSEGRGGWPWSERGGAAGATDR
jgi:competence protein ComEC